MVNEQLDLEWKEHVNDILSKKTSFLKQTKDFAFRIWDFIYNKYNEISPSSISIYQQYDGVIAVKCDDSTYFNLRSSSCDKALLHIVSIIAENSNMNGKMFLYSPEGLLNQLDFTF